MIPTVVDREKQLPEVDKLTLDVATPDLWDTFRRNREVLIGIGPEDVENTPFTLAEQAEIAEHVRHIRKLVKEASSVTGARMASIEAKLDNIEEVACRVGRKDWQFLFYGAMHGVRLLSPHSAQHTLVSALHKLDHLFGDPKQDDSRSGPAHPDRAGPEPIGRNTGQPGADEHWADITRELAGIADILISLDGRLGTLEKLLLDSPPS
jgi:hypothetical protein